MSADEAQSRSGAVVVAMGDSNLAVDMDTFAGSSVRETSQLQPLLSEDQQDAKPPISANMTSSYLPNVLNVRQVVSKNVAETRVLKQSMLSPLADENKKTERKGMDCDGGNAIHQECSTPSPILPSAKGLDLQTRVTDDAPFTPRAEDTTPGTSCFIPSSNTHDSYSNGIDSSNQHYRVSSQERAASHRKNAQMWATTDGGRSSDIAIQNTPTDIDPRDVEKREAGWGGRGGKGKHAGRRDAGIVGIDGVVLVGEWFPHSEAVVSLQVKYCADRVYEIGTASDMERRWRKYTLSYCIVYDRSNDMCTIECYIICKRYYFHTSKKCVV